LALVMSPLFTSALDGNPVDSTTGEPTGESVILSGHGLDHVNGCVRPNILVVDLQTCIGGAA